MAYTKYSLTPANNTATPPDGAPEGMLPSAVNDTMRDMMAQIRDVGDGIRNGTYTMTAPVITGGSITGVALSGNTFTNPVITGGSINNTPIGGTTANSGAFTTLSASGVATISAGTVSAPALTTTGDTNTGIFFPAADTIAFTEGGVESMRIDSSGNVGIGTSSPAYKVNAVVTSGSDAFFADGNAQSFSGYRIRAGASGQQWAFRGGNTTMALTDVTAGADRLVIDSSGNVGIGTSSPGSILDVQSATSIIRNTATTGTNQVSIRQGNTGGFFYTGIDTSTGGYLTGAAYAAFHWMSGNYPMIFATNNTERMRITSGGTVMINTTTDDQWFTTTNAGINFNVSNFIAVARSGGSPIIANRLTSDGDVIEIRQAGTTEGTISVSGTTVSYNSFAGSHWSQLSDGSKPEILRGTVMESINELCEWPNEPTSERLCRVKVSDTAGSKKVYGVFMDWDNDWTSTNDMLVTAVGAFVCRINKDVVVQEGDLLESNGDGTARVQVDDIMRSSTIGKVTCTEKTHQYADGSYCVPTVLYCG